MHRMLCQYACAALVLGLILTVPAFAAEPMLTTDQVDALPFGTAVHGSSTLDPSGPTRFDGRLLGVFRNVSGPGHDLIAIEIVPPFVSQNLIHGQSGSPVFVDVNGQPFKIGALAAGYDWALNPIAYLRPIQEVLQARENVPPVKLQAPGATAAWMATLMPKSDPLMVALSDGFTSGATISGTPTPPVAGSVLGVQLAWGDFDLTAYGTVSHVDGDKIFMFGHPFLQLGPTQYRLVPAKVLTVQRSVESSHIIAAPIAGAKAVGMITQDRETAIAGVLGKEPTDVIPVSFTLTTSKGEQHVFNFVSIADPTLAPQIIGYGVARGIASWSREMGDMTLFVNGTMEVEGAGNIEFSDSYTSAAGPFALLRSKAESVLQNKFTKAHIKKVTVTAKVFDEYRKLSVESLTVEPAMLKPGDTVTVKVVLSQQLKDPKTLTLQVVLPKDLQYGAGKIVVGSADAIEQVERAGAGVVNLSTLVESLNKKRRSDAVYVYLVLPPSKVGAAEAGAATEMQLGDIAAQLRKTSKRLSSNVEEYEVSVSDFQVEGSKEMEFKVGTNTSGLTLPPGHPPLP